MRGKRYKIIDIQETAPGQVFADPISGDGNHMFPFLHIGEPVARAFLAPDPGNKLLLRNVRTQLPHDAMAGGDLGIVVGDANTHIFHGLRRMVS